MNRDEIKIMGDGGELSEVSVDEADTIAVGSQSSASNLQRGRICIQSQHLAVGSDGFQNGLGVAASAESSVNQTLAGKGTQPLQHLVEQDGDVGRRLRHGQIPSSSNCWAIASGSSSTSALMLVHCAGSQISSRSYKPITTAS